MHLKQQAFTISFSMGGWTKTTSIFERKDTANLHCIQYLSHCKEA